MAIGRSWVRFTMGGLLGVGICVALAKRRLNQLSKTITLIVTADDLGFSRSRNLGILRAYKRGIVTRMSIAPNGLEVEHALDLIKRYKVPVEAIGLHLNLTEGSPICRDRARVSSLLLRPGETQAQTGWTSKIGSAPLFLGNDRFWKACEDGHVVRAHVATETEAQLAWFERKLGSPARWVDGHQHCHVAPRVVITIAETLRCHGVDIVRTPSQRLAALGGCLSCGRAAQCAKAARRTFESAGLASPSLFVGMNFCGNSYTPSEFVDSVAQEIKCSGFRGAGVSCEIMVHPGRLAENSKEKDGGVHWDAFDRSPARGSELETLCCARLPKMLADIGVRLSSSI